MSLKIKDTKKSERFFVFQISKEICNPTNLRFEVSLRNFQFQRDFWDTKKCKSIFGVQEKQSFSKHITNFEEI